ncbi:hypothetical protein [Priestia megaterium]|uniref:hypothetical protein n=1 Tax=Priestia megaterium TaxID=1404 RepID=UPI00177B1CFF|nr:hypothetical protein [Priestia megaterium]MBD8847070.1 hypothetical protein [Priestia megaterium]
MVWIPVFTSLITGIVALLSVWFTQNYQQHRWYADFFLKRKVDCISNFQVSLHQYISVLQKFDSFTNHSNDESQDKEEIQKEIFLKNSEFIEERIVEIKEAYLDLQSSYYLASTYLDKKDEIIIDKTLKKLIPLVKTISIIPELKKDRINSSFIKGMASTINKKIREAEVADTFEVLRDYLYPKNLRNRPK